MSEEETVLRYTPGEWLRCALALARAWALALASGLDAAVTSRETGRLKAAMATPSRRAGQDAPLPGEGSGPPLTRFRRRRGHRSPVRGPWSPE
jgi:hypothetical protein